MYEYAAKGKYLAENPMEKVQILVKFKQVVKKTGKTETFNTEELADMNTFLEKMYEEEMDVSYLAVKINFLLGLRVGELVANETPRSKLRGISPRLTSFVISLMRSKLRGIKPSF